MGRGGMRFGAGRPGHRLKAEHMQRIDVRELARRGYLSQDNFFIWQWHCGGEPSGSITAQVSMGEAVTLRYTVTLANSTPKDVADRVRLVTTPCAFGGTRTWFACPCCTQRVAVLYLRGGRFACRRCQKVAYASQSCNSMALAWRKQHKLEARSDAHWQRPKGMHERTYQRLVQGINDCEERRDAGLARFMAHFFSAK